MALAANSYGDTGEVASYCPTWVAGATGLFTTSTTPTLAQVESWCDQVSAALNSVLRENGFTVPVTQVDVKLLMDLFVNEETAMIVEGVHGLGRFGPEARGRSSGAKSRNQLIMEDAMAFIKANAAGMGAMGAARSDATNGGIAYRESNDDGKELEPWFARNDFGNTYKSN